jgi:hypothetical protein
MDDQSTQQPNLAKELQVAAWTRELQCQSAGRANWVDETGHRLMTRSLLKIKIADRVRLNLRRQKYLTDGSGSVAGAYLVARAKTT